MSRQTRKLVILLVVIELYFLLPLLVCGLAWYGAINAMRRSEVSKATVYTKLADPFFQLANSSYKVSRPALWLFHLHGYTDRALRVAGYVNQTALSGTRAAEKINRVLPLVMKSGKTAEDQRTLNKTMDDLRKTMPDLVDDLLVLSAETKNTKIDELHKAAAVANAFVQASDSMGGNKKEGRFLILFLNDKELRPGGGFIGSYGVATFGHYSLQGLEIHDVYDADGQLKEHIDPPLAVRTYLQNPHWFLRDSNFSPDFRENALRAEWFLGKELGAQPFDGVIGVTTHAIEDLIGAYGEVSLPDTGEVITKQNFYEKTQAKAQENFFPGSRQKQSTLAGLSQALLLNFDHVSKEALARTAKQSLEQKQLVAFIKNDKVQNLLEENNWAGRLETPPGDYLFPVEANVGVNKVNQFIKRSSNLEVKIAGKKGTKHILTTTFENNYAGPEPQNNTYKNYFQIYVPAPTQVNAVLVDGADTKYDVYNLNGRTVPSVYLEVPPQSQKKLTIIYTTPNIVETKIDSTYRLTVQKQTGLPSFPFSFSITLPKGSSVLSKSFPSEVKGNTLKSALLLNQDKEIILKFLQPE